MSAPSTVHASSSRLQSRCRRPNQARPPPDPPHPPHVPTPLAAASPYSSSRVGTGAPAASARLMYSPPAPTAPAAPAGAAPSTQAARQRGQVGCAPSRRRFLTHSPMQEEWQLLPQAAGREGGRVQGARPRGRRHGPPCVWAAVADLPSLRLLVQLALMAGSTAPVHAPAGTTGLPASLLTRTEADLLAGHLQRL